MIPARWALCGLLLAVFALYSPPAEPSLRLCGFLWLTHLPCPLCGMTRALCSLAKGEWHAAIGFHALSPLAMATLIGGCVWTWRFPAKFWSAYAALFLVYGIARMITL